MSRDLDKAKPKPGSKTTSQRGEAVGKAKALADGGISTSAAAGAEALAAQASASSQ